jgi:hypothetical protein
MTKVIVRKGYQPLDKNAIKALPEHIKESLIADSAPVD